MARVDIEPSELATGGGAYGRNAADDNWTINVGHWDIHWNSYLLIGGRDAAIDKWSLHAYGNDWHWVPSSPVGSTWNNMVAHGVAKSIWATEVNMDGSQTQRARADFFCNVNRTQPHELTFYMGAADGDANDQTYYQYPDLVSAGGLMGVVGNSYRPKWLLEAFHSILHGQQYYACR